jgi:transposase InsO family protein
MDTGAISQMANDPGILSSLNPTVSTSQIIVGNGAPLPVRQMGFTSIPCHIKPLSLCNVLISPGLIKNLISVRAFTRDNWVSVEFDPFVFSIKDLMMRTVLRGCDSTGELYPLLQKPPRNSGHRSFLAQHSGGLWHARLGHPGHNQLQQVLRSFDFVCSKESHSCHACRLDKNVRLPFHESNNVAAFPFHIIHCDVWTSPVVSNSGFKYYLVVSDDFTHFTWSFPLRHKSDVFPTFVSFRAFVQTQFQRQITCIQTNNGREFDNSALCSFLAAHGMALRLTFPYTSSQNGRAERVLHTLNGSMRTLLLHTGAPSRFWPDALATATYLLNCRPYCVRRNFTPYHLLLGTCPDYDHLRTFGCLCYPNTTATAAHKLSPRSAPYVFLGYPADSKGYRCYDMASRRVLTSRHVYFDESSFPFRTMTDASTPSAAPAVTADTILVPVPVAPRATASPAPVVP